MSCYVMSPDVDPRWIVGVAFTEYLNSLTFYTLLLYYLPMTNFMIIVLLQFHKLLFCSKLCEVCSNYEGLRSLKFNTGFVMSALFFLHFKLDNHILCNCIQNCLLIYHSYLSNYSSFTSKFNHMSILYNYIQYPFYGISHSVQIRQPEIWQPETRKETIELGQWKRINAP